MRYFILAIAAAALIFTGLHFVNAQDLGTEPPAPPPAPPPLSPTSCCGAQMQLDILLVDENGDEHWMSTPVSNGGTATVVIPAKYRDLSESKGFAIFGTAKVPPEGGCVFEVGNTFSPLTFQWADGALPDSDPAKWNGSNEQHGRFFPEKDLYRLYLAGTTHTLGDNFQPRGVPSHGKVDVKGQIDCHSSCRAHSCCPCPCVGGACAKGSFKVR